MREYLAGAQGSNEIADGLERAIVTGALAAGDRLPTVRALATDLGVSPATVATAYGRLGDRGLVAGRGRAGTSVLPRRSTVSRRVALPAPAGVLDLTAGAPDPLLLPDLATAVAAVAVDLDRAQGRSRGYGEDATLPALAEVLAVRLQSEGGPDGGGPGAVTAVAGVLDGVERALAAQVRPGDRVAVEDPGYTGLLDLLDSLGLEPAPVAVDPCGMRADSLARVLAGADGGRRPVAVVITLRAQNPTGASVTADRADQLAGVLAEHPQVLLVEDDHLGGLAGTPLHAPSALLQRAVAGRRRSSPAGQVPPWAHVHGLAKLLGPDLRVAGLVADPVTTARLRSRLQAGTGWVSWLLQRVAVQLLTDPGHPELAARAARAYALRGGMLTEALRARGIAAYQGTGLNVWVPVPQESAVTQSMLAAGIAVRPGEAFRLVSEPAVRLSTGTLDPTRAAAVAEALAGAIAGRSAAEGSGYLP